MALSNVPAEVRRAMNMKGTGVAVVVISAVVLLVPTVINIVRSEQRVASQYASYRFDGQRYVIDPSGWGYLTEEDTSNVEALNEMALLLNSAHGRETVKGATTATSALPPELATATDRISHVHRVEPATASIKRSADLPAVFVLETATEFVPVLVLATDGTFVTVIEPGVGKALYRISEFRTSWTGFIFELRSREQSGAPS